ncbi:DUF4142 domain-containing protein [Deinococcus maricopensis]|nr:DUF4142 domain-containing protein [Deinococcus maricopensis]
MTTTRTLVLAALMATGMAAAQSNVLNATDQAFVMKAGMSNTFEIEAAKLARQLGQTQAVKMYAEHMIADHTKLGAKVAAVTTKAQPPMTPPMTVNGKQQAMLNVLRTAGSMFDMKYKEFMIASHAETLALFEKYSSTPGTNMMLRQIVKGAIPTVKMHLDMAKKLPGM